MLSYLVVLLIAPLVAIFVEAKIFKVTPRLRKAVCMGFFSYGFVLLVILIIGYVRFTLLV